MLSLISDIISDMTFDLGIFLGLIALTTAVWWILKPRVEEMQKDIDGLRTDMGTLSTDLEEVQELLTANQRGQIAEMTGRIYAYANNVHRWEGEGLDAGRIAERVTSDLRAVSRWESSAEEDALNEFTKLYKSLQRGLMSLATNRRQTE